MEVVRGITVEWGLVGGEVVAAVAVVVVVPSRRSRSSVVVKDVMVDSIFIFVLVEFF